MSVDLTDAKQSLRTSMRGRLRIMEDSELAAKSAQIVLGVQAHGEWFEPGEHVAIFGGLRGEPDLLPLLGWLTARGVTPVVFGFANDELVPQAVRDAGDLERGAMGVWVPKPACPVVEAARLDVILTPGLAFDDRGMRLGRGKGYFDKLLSRVSEKALRVGICFGCQLVETVPAEAHDVSMNWVITEIADIAF